MSASVGGPFTKAVSSVAKPFEFAQVQIAAKARKEPKEGGG